MSRFTRFSGKIEIFGNLTRVKLLTKSMFDFWLLAKTRLLIKSPSYLQPNLYLFFFYTVNIKKEKKIFQSSYSLQMVQGPRTTCGRSCLWERGGRNNKLTQVQENPTITPKGMHAYIDT